MCRLSSLNTRWLQNASYSQKLSPVDSVTGSIVSFLTLTPPSLCVLKLESLLNTLSFHHTGQQLLLLIAPVFVHGFRYVIALQTVD